MCRIDCAGEHIDPIPTPIITPTPTITPEDVRALDRA